VKAEENTAARAEVNTAYKVMAGTNGNITSEGVAVTAIIMANTLFLEQTKNFLKKG